MAVGYPSVNSVRVARLASEQFIIDYTRNQDSFALPAYTQAVDAGGVSNDLYIRLDAQNGARILSSDGSSNIWPDGNDAPLGAWNVDSHDWRKFQTIRYAYPFRLGLKTVEEAEWDIVNQNTRSKAQQAMTLRATKTATLLCTEANHSNKTTTYSGTKWDAGTVVDPAFLDGLLAAFNKIQLASGGSVSRSDVVCVFNPDDAIKIATTAEIRDYVKNVDSARLNEDFFSGRPDIVNNYGLPLQYMGFTLRVEDTVRVSTPKNSAGTATAAYVWTAGKSVMLARPNGVTGSPTESIRLATCTIFERENMTVEISDNDAESRWNRIVRGRVVDDFDVVLTSPITAHYASGFMT